LTEKAKKVKKKAEKKKRKSEIGGESEKNKKARGSSVTGDRYLI